MDNIAVDEAATIKRNMSVGAWFLLLISAVGLWFPWAGFGYSYFETGGFHAGIFAQGAMEFLGFYVAALVATPLFTLIYFLYGRYSLPRSRCSQLAFMGQTGLLIAMWIALLATLRV